MALQVIEGTWEEIKLHEPELTGRRVRLTVKPEKPTATKPSVPADVAPKVKVLRGYGMLAGLISTEEYFREKREDTIREDRDLS